MSFNEEDQIYRKYMYRLNGQVTEEKLDYYNGILREFEALTNQTFELQAQYERGEITAQELQFQLEVQNSYSKRISGFQQVQDDMEYILRLQAQGIDAYFLDKLTAKAYFETSSMELKNAAVFMAAVILCISALYSSDIRKNMLPLLKSTPNGRGALVWSKYLWALVTVLILYAAVYVPYYIYVYRNVGALPLAAPVQSVRNFQRFGGSMTIAGLFVLRHCFAIMNALTAAAIVVALSVRLKNRVLSMIVSTALICVPLLLQSRGIELRWFSMNNAFLLLHTLTDPNALAKVVAQQAVIAAIGVVCVLATLSSFDALPRRRARR